MEKTIKILVLNNGKTVEVPLGANLEDVYQQSGLQMKYGPISAHVNNKVEGMHFRLYKQKQVEFLDVTSSSGNRAYTRTLFFVLCKAAHELFNPCKVAIDIPVSNGYYVNLNIGRPVTLEDAGAIRRRMQEIIDAAMPIHRHETTTQEAIELFDPCKVAIDIPGSNGYYVNLNIGRPVTLDDAGAIRRRMQEIIDAAMPIHRHETTTQEAI